VQAASREALAAARERLNSLVDSTGKQDLERLGDELFAIVRLLASHGIVRRHLADSSAPEAARTRMVDDLLAGKVGDHALEAVRALVTSRWSEPQDLVDGVEALARLATLAVSEKDGTLEEVEDELFRFGRILAAEPELRNLLADPVAAADRRVELLDSLIAGKVNPVTARLLRQTVRSPRGRSLDLAAEDLAELAAARRDRYVAHVTSGVALTAEQEQRLGQALSRIYRREISLQVEVDPDLQGGLVIRVGDEVIDGSVSGRLDRARHLLAGG
jgi:F-type H+-transporting ATPase subunit delta